MMKVTMIVLNSVWHDPRVRRTATSTVQHSIDTTVVGLKDSVYKSEKVSELPFRTIIVAMDEKYYRSNRTIFTILKREFLLYRKLIKACIASDPDIIHANDLNALPVAYFSSKKTKSKIVYDSHELFTEHSEMCRGWLRKFFWKTVEHFLIKRVNQVVSVSNSAAEELVKMYNIDKPMVLTNCVFRVDQSLLLPKPSNRFEVLYHGKFYRGRGYEAFVQAAVLMQKYADIQFVLRGFGIIEKELRAIATDNNLGEKLRFDPPVDVTELVLAASSSHVGVVLTEPVDKNFIHTVSNKLFEYVNAGLPVILSNMPEHRYLNDKYGFGIIIDEVTPPKIAAAVLKLYNDHQLFTNLCQNSKKASEMLNWDTEVLRLLEVYKKLLASDRIKKMRIAH